jgi:acetyltransferase-like isoleucine patch superfamily enzyme
MKDFILSYISMIISNLKGEQWELDRKIPLKYLLNLILIRWIMRLRGLILLPLFSPRAYVGKNVSIHCNSKFRFGKNLTIGSYSYLNALSEGGIILGNNVSMGEYTTIKCSGTYINIGKGLIVGNNVGLGSNCFFGAAGGIEIGDDTIFGNLVSIHSENHNFNNSNLPIRLQGVNRIGVIIGNNCWIGAKSTILDGAIIADNVIIAAGSVVLKGDYKSNSIYGGNPARFIKYIS